MSHNLRTVLVVASVLFIGAMGVLAWKKKKRSFRKVGKISKLFFFPVKSMKAIEVTEGKCTKYGFEVNGLLDRSFMVVDGGGRLISQRQEPTMVHFTPCVSGNTLSITAPTGQVLKVPIKDNVSSTDKIINCFIDVFSIDGVDCGEEASVFFKQFFKAPEIHLVQQFPSLPKRKYLKNDPFLKEITKKFFVAFQDEAAFHILSEASVNHLNSKVENRNISFLNFRPNILASECEAYAEDAWQYVKFISGAELCNWRPTPRCILTTNDLATAVLDMKDPLVTLRKYRIPKDPAMLKKTKSVPCIGVSCAVLKDGDISVGEDIFANVGKTPEMSLKNPL